MIVKRNSLSPPSMAVFPIIVSLIRGILTIAIIKAPPTRTLVKFATENVKFLKSEILKRGFEVRVILIPNRVKKIIAMIRKLTK